MLIQNVSGVAMAPQSVRIASDGAPRVVDIAETQTGTAQVSPQQPSSEQLKSAVDSINHAMQQSNQGLEFSIDPATKTPVVKVTDKATGKVITQFPSEQVLAIAQSIDQFLKQKSLLFKQEA